MSGIRQGAKVYRVSMCTKVRSSELEWTKARKSSVGRGFVVVFDSVSCLYSRWNEQRATQSERETHTNAYRDAQTHRHTDAHTHRLATVHKPAIFWQVNERKRVKRLRRRRRRRRIQERNETRRSEALLDFVG